MFTSCKHTLLLCLPLTLSCNVFKKERKKHTVMVVDSSFDLQTNILKDSVDASYSIVCQDTFPQEKYLHLPQEQIEAKIIEFFEKTKTTNNCKIVEGFVTEEPQTKKALALKNRWNKSVRQRDFSSLERSDIHIMQDVSVISHGTATASLIAYKNPVVRLITVQLPELLRKTDDSGFFEQCQKEEYKEYYKKVSNILKKDDIKNRALTTKNHLDAMIHHIALKHNVSIISKSYGVPPQKNIKKYLNSIHCEEYGDFIVQLLDINEKRSEQKNHTDLPYIEVQSAGNESTVINSRTDSYRCSHPQNNRLIVGSNDLTNKISSFSNYGNCVDVYAFGSNIITSTSGGVLFPLDGTSFSTPLVSRWLTTETTPDSSFSQKKETIKKALNSKKFLKSKGSWPDQFLFDYNQGRRSSLYLQDGKTLVFGDFKDIYINSMTLNDFFDILE